MAHNGFRAQVRTMADRIPTPEDEEDRLRSLERQEVLDTPPEEPFDRITSLASNVLGTPIALVSLVDQSRQWFKSKVGLEADETPREVAFCAHAICGDEVFVVSDASLDPRFSENPLVTSDPNIRFYAGAPLRTPEGAKLGTLCVIDRAPREFTNDEKGILASLAELVVRELELRKAANTDPLTGAYNRRQFEDFCQFEWLRAEEQGRSLALLLVDVDHFKQINDRHGHEVGDHALKCVSSVCQGSLRHQDIWARLGGEEFGALLVDSNLASALALSERLKKSVMDLEVDANRGTLTVTISGGIAICDPSRMTFDQAIRRADAALYRAKQSGRNRFELSKDDGPGKAADLNPTETRHAESIG